MPKNKHLDLTTWLTTQRSKTRRLPVFGDWRIGRKQMIPLLQGMLQFRFAVKQFYQLDQLVREKMTLAQFINRYKIQDAFWHGCMMPVLYTLCTCDEKVLGDWLAEPLIDFLLKMQQGSPLLRMYGGTHGFVSALTKDICFYSGAKVTQVHCAADGVDVYNAAGQKLRVDKVIVATPTHIIDFLDENKFEAELACLRQYQFTQGELLIHTDQNCMPKDKKHWSALSYIMDENYNQQMFSVWLNAVEPSLVGKQAIFQSWNPTIKIDESKVIDRVKLTRAIVDQKTRENSQKMLEMQKDPARQVYFCGSWLCDGLPILESAVTSAMFVTEQLGVEAKFKDLSPVIVPAQALANVMAN